MKRLLIFFSLLLLFSACRKDKTTFQPTPYALYFPSHFPDMIIPSDNPMTQEGVELGRWLFFEKRLSANDSMSCASCHLAQSSFSDPNKYSTGIDGIAGNRNSMALINLGWDNFFFWDGRAADLKEQAMGPVQASVREGARLLAGGNPIAGPGAFYEPTVLDRVTPRAPSCGLARIICAMTA